MNDNAVPTAPFPFGVIFAASPPLAPCTPNLAQSDTHHAARAIGPSLSRLTSSLLLLPTFLLAVVLSPARAQWVQLDGPYGGSIYTMVYTGQVVLAGTLGGGVYRSMDRGQHWLPSNSGLGSYYIETLLVKGADVFAGTPDKGVFRSTDGGVTWAPTGAGLEAVYVFVLLQKDQQIFAGVYDPEGGDPIYRSTDDGNSWHVVPMGLQYAWILSLAVHKGSIFAGFDGALYRSTDDGQTWSKDNSREWYQINALLSLGDTLIAGCADGILISSGDNSAWTLSNSGFSNPLFPWVHSLQVRGSILFAATSYGMYRSTNMGTTWSECNWGFTVHRAETICVLTSDVLVGTGGSGVFSSSDDGLEWSQSSTGMNSTCPLAFLDDAGTLLVGSRDGGVYSTTNNGSSWSTRNTGLEKPYVTSLAKSGGALFAGTSFAGVYRSSDEGLSWSAANTGLGSLEVHAAGCVGSSVIVATELGEFRSTDFGDTWEPDGQWGSSLHSIAVAGGLIYLGTVWGLLRSSDEGVTWVDISGGMTNVWSGVMSIAASDQEIIVGTTAGGVYRSTDDGANWDLLGAYPDSLRISSIAQVGRTIFCATQLGVYRFNLDGTGWYSVSDGFTNPSVTRLFALDTNLYAGTDGCGIWRRPLSQLTSIETGKTVYPFVTQFALEQNYPNPFNPSTVIGYRVEGMGDRVWVTLKVYDILGREVATLVNEVKQPGAYTVPFEGSNLASGVYFYRLSAGNFVQTKKLILLR